ncbi:hypothetical protein [Chitinophaga tropicalis]|uniref:Uncharacterized protein n=1 Tax=Chitinophaga tropicalis TaxID=2683588 RepID=A0A7K1UAH4_9BACT|nr:hypothetical protein [Chitinophaga tropicalis]MVT11369.1 hypothetical protein [Chitinophaga tropicalis]
MNVIEQYNARKQQCLQAQKMPSALITDRWFTAVKTALCCSSPMSLGIQVTDFRRLYHSDKDELTLMDFAILSNNLESKSANELGVPMYEYLASLSEGVAPVKQWQDVVSEIDESIKKELAEEAIKMKEAGINQVGGFLNNPAKA